jgi:predicted ABC-type sugar transport system permease subunit
LVSNDLDPVSARRARIARWVKLAQRIGYSILLAAIVAFVVAAATDFPGWLVGVIVGCLVGAIIILPVPIVLGYGVRAAERDERRERAEQAGHGGS